MYLYKHPKETKENKARAHRLIQAWSRPIFNNDVDFHSMSKEEREERDKRSIERHREANAKRARTESPVKKTSEKVPAPGEKGWVPRARVPQPSARDYVNRPRSSAEVDMSRGSGKKMATRYEMMQRTFNEKKKSAKMTGAIKVSIEGRKM
jgi:transcription factor SPN1